MAVSSSLPETIIAPIPVTCLPRALQLTSQVSCDPPRLLSMPRGARLGKAPSLSSRQGGVYVFQLFDHCGQRHVLCCSWPSSSPSAWAAYGEDSPLVLTLALTSAQLSDKGDTTASQPLSPGPTQNKNLKNPTWPPRGGLVHLLMMAAPGPPWGPYHVLSKAFQPLTTSIIRKSLPWPKPSSACCCLCL